MCLEILKLDETLFKSFWFWIFNDIFIFNWKSTIFHYSDVIMTAMASQIMGLSIVYSTGCSGADQRKHQNPTSLAFVRGNHRWPVNSPLKGPVTQKTFPCDDVIMQYKQVKSLEIWSLSHTNLRFNDMPSLNFYTTWNGQLILCGFNRIYMVISV